MVFYVPFQVGNPVSFVYRNFYLTIRSTREVKRPLCTTLKNLNRLYRTIHLVAKN